MYKIPRKSHPVWLGNTWPSHMPSPGFKPWTQQWKSSALPAELALCLILFMYLQTVTSTYHCQLLVLKHYRISITSLKYQRIASQHTLISELLNLILHWLKYKNRVITTYHRSVVGTDWGISMVWWLQSISNAGARNQAWAALVIGQNMNHWANHTANFRISSIHHPVLLS